MQIEQLARITGVSLDNIRRYRSAGLLPSAEGVITNDGFSEPDVHALKLIKLAVKAGLSLREIVTILEAKSCATASHRYARAYAWLQARRNKLAAVQASARKQDLSALDSLIKELRILFFA